MIRSLQAELEKASRLLEGPAKLDNNQICYLTGVCQALRWAMFDPNTEAPTEGFYD